MPRAKRLSSVPLSDGVQHVPDVKTVPYACAEDAKWAGFLNVRLSDDDTDDFTEWLKSAQLESGWELLASCLMSGLKMSLSRDEEHSAYICTFTGDLLREGCRRAITSRAPVWSTAVLLMVYKHCVLLKGDYSSTVTPKSNFMQFG